MLSTYHYSLEKAPINVPLTVLSGKNDDITNEQLETWCNFTARETSVHYFEGGHFFINNNTAKITRLINRELFQKDLMC